MNQSRYWRDKNAELLEKHDALRQQLADVSNERDGLQSGYQTLHEVIVRIKGEREELKAQLNASEARNADLEKALRKFPGFSSGSGKFEREWLALQDYVLAQSAPATDEQGPLLEGLTDEEWQEKDDQDRYENEAHFADDGLLRGES